VQPRDWVVHLVSVREFRVKLVASDTILCDNACMRLSTRMCYGTRALLELSVHYGSGAMPLAIISRSQDLPVKYLEQLMHSLKSSGLVLAVRGAKGGYTLAREPHKIRMSEVYICLEGPVTTVDCVQHEDVCERTAFCPTRSVWTDVHDAIMGILGSMTLQDMLDSAEQ
jgi:Rrf2 family cysteine metabolism transcriptional repressor